MNSSHSPFMVCYISFGGGGGGKTDRLFRLSTYAFPIALNTF